MVPQYSLRYHFIDHLSVCLCTETITLTSTQISYRICCKLDKVFYPNYIRNKRELKAEWLKSIPGPLERNHNVVTSSHAYISRTPHLPPHICNDKGTFFSAYVMWLQPCIPVGDVCKKGRLNAENCILCYYLSSC